MPRILADLPDDDIKWLDARAAEGGKSRASVLREAVQAYRAEVSDDWLEVGFGLWARHGIAMDPHEYERKRRAEWTRPWDDDYDEVRAESPIALTSMTIASGRIIWLSKRRRPRRARSALHEWL